MPPVSEAQRRLMAQAASDPTFAKQRGISQDMAREFISADTGGKLPDRISRQSKGKTKKPRKLTGLLGMR